MKFTIIGFFSKCGHPQEKSDLVTFTEEILNGKLCAVHWTVIFGVFLM